MKLNNNDDSHNSGLNLLIYNMLLDIESHPAWVCGLKQSRWETSSPITVTSRPDGTAAMTCTVPPSVPILPRASRFSGRRTAGMILGTVRMAGRWIWSCVWKTAPFRRP